MLQPLKHCMAVCKHKVILEALLSWRTKQKLHAWHVPEGDSCSKPEFLVLADLIHGPIILHALPDIVTGSLHLQKSSPLCCYLDEVQ